jgi:cytochrome c-type biogenesis protein CcmF
MLGSIGDILILTAFVSSIVSGFAYLTAARQPRQSETWLKTGRRAWLTMLFASVGASVILSHAIFTHQFQFHYVWSNTSVGLHPKYLFSAFWAGQEGSFLLWIMFTAIVGWLAARWARNGYEAHIMAIMGLCQAFMISMVVGIDFGSFAVGASPFALLTEKFPDSPFLASGGVPPDGNGLNDLLQNYWMVIHPPTLFLGFTTMIVPFAYAVAGLWRRQYTQWVRPALPWALASTLILMVGITLGGYWAYVTLSFGGYWAWDPVENSSFVPFLIGAAAVHTMIAQKKSGSSHKASLLLCILAFMTVIYSTFLTRSGVLGEVSVHSFVDLGLYNQLLMWILTIALLGFGLFIYRYRELPVPEKEPQVMSREFMIFFGAMVVCAIAAVVLLGTSTPIIGRIFRDNPSGVPMEFYNKWTLPMSALLALLLGVGQLFWWTKMSVDRLNKLVAKPLAMAVASTAVVLLATPFAEVTANPPSVAASGVSNALQAGLAASMGAYWSQYGTGLLLLLLVFCSFFALYSNSFVLWKIGRGNLKLAGGAIAHIGLAMVLLGIVTSSGMNDPIADPRRTDRENFVIERGQTMFVDGFQVTYTGTNTNMEGHTEYLLDFRDSADRTFSMSPVVYKSNKEQWIQHPDIKTYFEQDVYVAVSPQAMFESEPQSSGDLQIRLKRGESAVLPGTSYSMVFEQFFIDTDSVHSADAGVEMAVSARVRITDSESGESRAVMPVYMIDQNRRQQYIPATIQEWDMTVSFVGMSVDDGSIMILVDGVGGAPPDWIVVQAYRKPFINLLWFGIFLLSVGFVMSIYRRVDENRFERERGN